MGVEHTQFTTPCISNICVLLFGQSSQIRSLLETRGPAYGPAKVAAGWQKHWLVWSCCMPICNSDTANNRKSECYFLADEASP